MSRETCESKLSGAGERGSHTYTQITHQELPQVFVVGDDAVVDDDELWGQRKCPAQPHTSPVSDRQQRPQSFVWKLLGRTRRVSPPGEISLLCPIWWLVMAEDHDPAGTRATQTLQLVNPTVLLPPRQCCSYTQHQPSCTEQTSPLPYSADCEKNISK